VFETRKTMPASCSVKTKPYTIKVYDFGFYIDTLEIKSVNLRTAESTHLKAMLEIKQVQTTSNICTFLFAKMSSVKMRQRIIIFFTQAFDVSL